MQFTIEGGGLSKLLGYLLLAAPPDKRDSRAVIRAKAEGRLELHRTGMGTQGRVTAPLPISEAGEAVIDAEALKAVLKGTGTKETITLRTTDKTLMIERGTGAYRIPCLEEEVPEIDPKEALAEFTLPGALFSGEIGRVSKAAATFEPYNLVHVEIQGKNGKGDRRLTELVSTDRHRLFQSSFHLEGEGDGKQALTLNLPIETAGAWRELAQSFDVPGRLTLYKEVADLAGAVAGGIEILARSAMVDMKFPAWREIVPKKFVTTARVDKNALVQALRAIRLLATPLANGVRLDLAGDEIALSLQSPDIGSGTLQVPATIEGEKQAILFNVHFLLEAAAGIEGETAVLKFAGEEMPLILETTGHPYFAVVMPLRT